MADVPVSTPALPVRPLGKEPNRFVRKRSNRRKPPDDGSTEGDDSSQSDNSGGEAPPAEHIDTYA
ncbi:hypothetical protein MoryE10_20930 [Methylogaea oryzae]|uniref:Uncharacterized protein n=1 Tax=Methylogaea oryzae TaxID=1295382 RepID=A0A8D4VRY5_9GAMM|nr:hypothetical protein MoryE10_20930 [Methylogaea oryzae]